MIKRLFIGFVLILFITVPGSAATTNAPDTPVNLEAINITQNSVTLRWGPGPPGEQFFVTSKPTSVTIGWGAAQDTRGITGYNIYKDGSLMASNVNALQYKVTGITNKTVSFRVCVYAVNGVGQVSSPMCAVWNRI